MKKFLSRNFLKSQLTSNIWFNLTKNLNFNSIKPGCVYKVLYSSVTKTDVQLKNFIGICIGKYGNSSNNQSFCLRNFYKTDSIEMIFFLNSPLIQNIVELKNYKRKTSFSKLYYLRDLKRKTYKK